MNAPRLRADRARCTGAGQCARTAPTLFDQDDDGLAVLLIPNPPVEALSQARLAADLCPSGAIALHGDLPRARPITE
ncbi:ferredoxin [Nocardiopsis ansamitocini]|uniref:Ferredoxin n=1 Tax=Nocardiopsis ansamitocini TaxID=1670832 RepID=A0A9W6ULL4_9ACTN|nr:ferredoxin [Nocardiopsis ansamitocini]GLU50195.1 ferredoxin [Nocardiopsis ansamitocini]